MDRLKQKIERATDIEEPWEYFNAEIAFSPGFDELGTAGNNPNLYDVLTAGAEQVFGLKLNLTPHTLIHIPEFSLWHGIFLLGIFRSAVVYCDDINKGIVAIIADPLTERVEFLRFSLYMLPKDTFLSTDSGSA